MDRLSAGCFHAYPTPYLLTFSHKIGKLSYVVSLIREFPLLVIRLARTGRAKYPTYRIVAAESARAATGKFVAVLGHYNPHTKELVIKSEEVQKHLSHGAQPSNTVIKLLSREKVELPEWVKLKTKTPKPQAEEAAANEAPKAETAEAPAVENADQRVAEATEEVVTEVEDNQTPIDRTDTAESEAAAAAQAKAAEDVAAEAASE